MVNKIDVAAFEEGVKPWTDFLCAEENAFLLTTARRMLYQEYLESFFFMNGKRPYTVYEIPIIYSNKILYKYREQYFGRFWTPASQQGSSSKAIWIYQLDKEKHLCFVPYAHKDEIAVCCDIVDFGEEPITQQFMKDNADLKINTKSDNGGFGFGGVRR